MGRCVIKLNDGKRDYYLKWSTVVDAPTTYGLTRDEMAKLLLKEGVAELKKEIEASLTRADAKGASWQDSPLYDLEYTLGCNRAGPGERHASKATIIRLYCHEREDDPRAKDGS